MPDRNQRLAVSWPLYTGLLRAKELIASAFSAQQKRKQA
ncbi:hypothetical protein OKW43_007277 [Paraburkholderia sp. WC7.3g]